MQLSMKFVLEDRKDDYGTKEFVWIICADCI